MRLTYVDSGVLIAAFRGKGALGERALGVISDTASRSFVCSDYVRLEVLPKPAYWALTQEQRFYEVFFETVSVWLPAKVEHFPLALREACSAGLQAMDALHLVAACEAGCEEFVTSERPGKAIHRSRLVAVTSIDDQ